MAWHRHLTLFISFGLLYVAGCQGTKDSETTDWRDATNPSPVPPDAGPDSSIMDQDTEGEGDSGHLQPQPDAALDGGGPEDDIYMCQVLVVGGGTGGVAAALEAARRGAETCLVESSDWLGGQFTAQGVSAPDENRHIEMVAGGTYRQFRDGIRSAYAGSLSHPRTPDAVNPGDCWVSKLCHEPRIALQVIDEMLAPWEAQGTLKLFLEHHLESVEVDGDRVLGATFTHGSDGTRVRFTADVTIDATELGDVIGLSGAESRVGAESKQETGEHHAPATALPTCVQAWTFPFIVEWDPSAAPENLLPAPPPGYREEEVTQGGVVQVQGIFEDAPYRLNGYAVRDGQESGGQRSTTFWNYRSLIAAHQFSSALYPNDLAMINWDGGNDFYGGDLVSASREERLALKERARHQALGFLYWLQRHAPRAGGGFGHPELRLRPDLLGTLDGLSKYPYIRESRRLVGLTRIVEQDISAQFITTARARLFPDSIGIGLYHIDIRPCTDHPTEALRWQETRPFQIPFGALVPVRMDGLLAGAKNISTTRITNGAYRMHPTEWATGQAAGAAAALAVAQGVDVRRFAMDQWRLRQLQILLIEDNVPVHWYQDLPHDAPYFKAAQIAAAAGVIQGHANNLNFGALESHTRAQAARITIALAEIPIVQSGVSPFTDVPTSHWAHDIINTLAGLGILTGDGTGRFRPDDPVTRAEFVTMLTKALGMNDPPPASPTFTDVPTSHWAYAFVERAVAAGLVIGDGQGTFRPDAPLLRQESVHVAARAIQQQVN